MAKKLRSVNTEFWADEYIGEQSRDAKLLFLYFIANPLTNLAGAYKISRKVIKQDTGFTDAELDTLLEQFEAAKKVFYRDGWIYLPNYIKNQALNGNMRTSVINQALESPDWIQAGIAKTIKESSKLWSDFETVRSLVLTLKTTSPNRKGIEREDEKEREVEERGETPPPTKPPVVPIGLEKSKWDHPGVIAFEEIFLFKVGTGFAKGVNEIVQDLEVWNALLQNKRAYADKPLEERKKVCNWILDEYEKRVKEKQNGQPIKNFREERSKETITDRNIVDAARQRIAEADAKLSGSDVGNSVGQLRIVGSEPDNGRKALTG